MSMDPAMLERVRTAPVYFAPEFPPSAPAPQYYAEVPEWKRRVKRVIDVLMAVAALGAFALLLPLIALAIRIDSPGPIFYEQVRVGINRRARDRRRDIGRSEGDDRRCSMRRRDRRKVVCQGRSFAIIKLRTMRTDAESEGARWAHKGDPRVTTVGRFLRRSRLDEVPQFWNVLLGDMSVVGPRPERPPFIEMLSGEVPGYLHRLRFKPGITGLSQVELGYDTDVEGVRRKVVTDVRYISEFGLLNDLRIMLRTVTVVLTGHGAC